MMNEYFFSHQKGSPIKKLQTSGSFGFRSSQFSERSNKSIRQDLKDINPSFFNESSIKKLDNDDSGQFIYFKNDSVLSGLDLGLDNKKKSSFKQQQGQKKKKQSINYSGEIQFQDSLQKSKDIDSSKIKEYGTGKSNLPPTLKKPKFGFKTSQTAESSAIMKDAQVSVVMNDSGNEYQLQIDNKLLQKQRNAKLKETPLKQNVKNDSQNMSRQNFYQNQNSISSIKKPHQQPSIVSKSLSQSNSLSGSMNFKSVFKNKVEKASSIYKKGRHSKSNNSLLSYKSINKQQSKNDILENEVKIAQLKNLRQLQNQLGKLKHQNKKIIQYMIEKDQQIENLKKKKIEIEQEDPYAIIKENQLMKAFLNNKANNKNSSKVITSKQDLPYGTCLRSAKSLKQLSLKKSSQISSLHDYDIKQHKFKVQSKALTKTEKKMILSNRGVLLSQKQIDVGYSLKDNILTLYLTVKKQFFQLRVKLEQNSFILSDQIDRLLKDLPIGKQIKFKTQIKSTKCRTPSDEDSLLCLKISLSNQQKFQNQTKQYKLQLPILVYDISKQIQSCMDSRSIQKSSRISNKQIFKTQTFVSCKQMIRDPQNYLMKIFPMGNYSKQSNTFFIGFLWKQKQDFIKIRLKERSFVIEGQGNPNNVTFQLLRNIVSLLIQCKTQQ